MEGAGRGAEGQSKVPNALHPSSPGLGAAQPLMVQYKGSESGQGREVGGR